MAGDGRAAGSRAGARGAGGGAACGVRAGAEQAEILAGVLAGIELGAWDRRVLDWLAGLDASTVLTVASWIARSRAAGPGR